MIRSFADAGADGAAAILGPFNKSGVRQLHARFLDTGGAAIDSVSVEVFGSSGRPGTVTDWLEALSLTAGAFSVPANHQRATGGGMFQVDASIEIPEGIRWVGVVIRTQSQTAYAGYASLEDD